MNLNKVVVMLPNARRQTVKVNPNKTVLEILEEACQKNDLPSNDYDLKHHNRILDLTQMFRFSGLPNNCLLEMVEATQKRTESDVVLCLQLEDGTRPQGSFSPVQTLHDVLTKLCPEWMGHDKNPVVIYMRKEIFGDMLAGTTLRSLGITGGRAMVRVVDKNPDELKTQANVYVPSSREEVKTEEKTEVKKPVSRTVAEKSGTDLIKAIKQVKEEIAVKKGISDPESQMDVEKPFEKISEGESEPKKYDWGSTGNTLAGKKVAVEMAAEDACDMDVEDNVLEELEGQICTLGDHNAVLFSLNEAQRVPDDLPDTFFELTVQDLQYLLRDLKRQREEQNEMPLLTEKMRELENSNKILNKLGQYKKSVIRVQFPNRLVLQGTFSPVDTIETVRNFVKDYIVDANLDFYLFTIPPKKIVPSDQTLIEADCVPTAVLHFGMDGEIPDEVLKPDLLSKLTTPDGAILAASKSRGLISTKRRPNQSSDDNNLPGPSSTGAIPKQPKAESFKQSTASQKPSGYVPKWFKQPGK